jgi:hypothetical protein
MSMPSKKCSQSLSLYYLRQGKKGKVVPLLNLLSTIPWSRMGQRICTFIHVGYEWPVSCPCYSLPPRDTHWKGGWVGRRASMDDMEKWELLIFRRYINCATPIHIMNKKDKVTPVNVCEDPKGCDTSRFPHLLDSRLTDGGEVVSLTRMPSFASREIPGTYFCQRLSTSQDCSAAGRIRSIETSSGLFGNRTRDLSACNILPQPTTLQREVTSDGTILIRIFTKRYQLLQNLWDGGYMVTVYHTPVFLVRKEMYAKMSEPSADFVPVRFMQRAFPFPYGFHGRLFCLFLSSFSLLALFNGVDYRAD